MSTEPDGPQGAADPVPDPGAVEPTLARGWRAVGKGADRVHTEGEVVADPPAASAEEDDAEAQSFAGDEVVHDDQPVEAGNGALLGIGILAGVYLLYVIGWFIGGNRLDVVGDLLLANGPIYTIVKWTAIAAPAVWFAVVFVLTLRSRTWVRFVWLIVGVVLLVPWPFVISWESALMGGVQ